MLTGTTLICLCRTLFCDATTCWAWYSQFQLQYNFSYVSLNTFSYYAGGGVVPVSMLVAPPANSLCPCELANYATSLTPDTKPPPPLVWIAEFDIRLISITFHWYRPSQILLISDIPSTYQRWWISPWAREFCILLRPIWEVPYSNLGHRNLNPKVLSWFSPSSSCLTLRLERWTHRR